MSLDEAKIQGRINFDKKVKYIKMIKRITMA